MKRSDVRSNRVGRAMLATGGVTIAYRAVVEFTCVQCAGTIAPGALFSRKSRRTPPGVFGLTATDPICTTCQPLRLQDNGETETAATDAREE